jgi:pimeloyl-ACP methyl ester carboxylesterase
VIVGTEDVEDILAMADHLATQIPGARLARIEGAGHLPSLERPDELNRLLLDFLR